MDTKIIESSVVSRQGGIVLDMSCMSKVPVIRIL